MNNGKNYGEKMKKKTFFTGTAVLALVFTLALVSCFSPWQSDEATLTILTNGASSRVLVDIKGNEQAAFSYELTLTGPAEKKTFQFAPGAPLSVKVTPGKWQVEVRAMGTHDYAGGLFPDGDILRAFGEWEGNVGRDIAVPITMYSASEVSSWAQLEAAVDSDPDGDRKEIIFLKSGGVWTVENTIEIGRPIELRAAEAVTINRGTNIGQFFYIKQNTTASLILKGPLTLDGTSASNQNSDSLIMVGDGSKLEMYDGVTLQNNNKSTGNGGGVNVTFGGTFNMYGGSIRGNTAINNVNNARGGGVFVSDNNGIFTMTGGRIYGNSANLGNSVYGGEGSTIIIFGSSKDTSNEYIENNNIP